MNAALLGSFGKRMLAAGWTRERALAILGGGDFDLTDAPPGEGAKLTAIAILGSIEVIVDHGTQVTMSGFSLFGHREVAVPGGNGPAMHLRGVAILGSVEVKPTTARNERPTD